MANSSLSVKVVPGCGKFPRPLSTHVMGPIVTEFAPTHHAPS